MPAVGRTNLFMWWTLDFHRLAWPDFGLQFWKMPGQLTCYIGIVRIHAGSFVLIQLCLRRCSSPLRLWKADSVHRIGHIKTSSECFCRVVSVIWECLKPNRNRYIWYMFLKKQRSWRDSTWLFYVTRFVQKAGSSSESEKSLWEAPSLPMEESRWDQCEMDPLILLKHQLDPHHLELLLCYATTSMIANHISPSLTTTHHSPLATIISIDHWFVGFLGPGLRRLFLWLRSMKRKVTTSRRAQPVRMCSELRNLDLDGKDMWRFKGWSCNCQRVPSCRLIVRDVLLCRKS